MVRSLFKTLFVLLVGLALVGCAPTAKKDFKTPFTPKDLNAKLKAGEVTQAVDNFIVILDASNSKNAYYAGKDKFSYSRDLVSRMNQTIPNMELNGALRTFGGGSTSASPDKTRLIYGFEKYTKSKFDSALSSTQPAKGLSFMGSAINASAMDMRSVKGKTAVIIVSDGKIHVEDPVKAAADLKAQYKNNVCIYTVFVSSPTKDIKQVARDKGLMKKVAEAGKCGFASMAGDIYSAKGMAAFVEKVFFTKTSDSDKDGVMNSKDQCPNTPRGAIVNAVGCPKDSDRDGVYDGIDQCPNTPYGATVDSRGCPADNDNDGVYDGIDQCPDTRRGAKVDAVGCELKKARQPAKTPTRVDSDGDGVADGKDQCPDTPRGVKVNINGCWVLGGLTFDSGKWNIKPKYYSELDEVVNALNKNPELKVEVQGHTDNVGSARYNTRLSGKRAKSVMDYLISKGIAPSRLSSKGYGFSRPTTTNSTPEGREMNRRVELKPIY